MQRSTELPVLPFASKKKWADWLAEQHEKSAGVWLKLAKKDSDIPSITYDEALEVALCYGWIDGQEIGRLIKDFLSRKRSNNVAEKIFAYLFYCYDAGFSLLPGIGATNPACTNYCSQSVSR